MRPFLCRVRVGYPPVPTVWGWTTMLVPVWISRDAGDATRLFVGVLVTPLLSLS